MGLTLNSPTDAIARAYDAYVDKCHDEYYRDYGVCPECGDESLDGNSGRSRGGWWYEVWCLNDECGYRHDDCQAYDE